MRVNNGFGNNQSYASDSTEGNRKIKTTRRTNNKLRTYRIPVKQTRQQLRTQFFKNISNIKKFKTDFIEIKPLTIPAILTSSNSTLTMQEVCKGHTLDSEAAQKDAISLKRQKSIHHYI